METHAKTIHNNTQHTTPLLSSPPSPYTLTRITLMPKVSHAWRSHDHPHVDMDTADHRDRTTETHAISTVMLSLHGMATRTTNSLRPTLLWTHDQRLTTQTPTNANMRLERRGFVCAPVQTRSRHALNHQNTHRAEMKNK